MTDLNVRLTDPENGNVIYQFSVHGNKLDPNLGHMSDIIRNAIRQAFDVGDYVEPKEKIVWEKQGEGIYRFVVPGGWIYSIDGEELMLFVPDPIELNNIGFQLQRIHEELGNVVSKT